MDGSKASRLVPRLETVADPRVCDDVAGSAFVGLNFLPQMANKNAQIFRLFHAVGAPDRGKQHAVGDDSAGGVGES